MNYKIIFNTLGKVVLLLAGLLLIPVILSFVLDEAFMGLLITFCIALVIGVLLTTLVKPTVKEIYAKEGLVTVSFAWIIVSLIGCLPFVITGAIPSFIDALFETVSGFTTTGASILSDVEGMAKSLLLWRSLTHWIGGMGVLVFVMAISPKVSEKTMNILRAEMPGPTVDKILPKTRTMAGILYLIYIGLTLILFVMLICGGMPVFDSAVHALGTAGTGGFGIKADSVASYSNYVQWVIAVFMMLFGINFNMYFLLIIRKFGNFFKSRELWVYLAIILVAIVAICFNIYNMYKDISTVIRLSFFQVASVISTTGFSTCDFNMWPSFSKAILIMLMFVGGCAGSTAGGLKVSRVSIAFKKIGNEINKTVHPHSANIVMFEGRRVESDTVHGIMIYFVIYFITLFTVFLLLSINGFDMETNFSASLACLNNIGPGLGQVGPAVTYQNYSVFSKIILILAMLLGRLEIYPLLVSINPMTYIKK